jgi:8-oxo-dGTP diphosphatase
MKHYNVSAAIIFVENKILCVQRGSSKYDYISCKYEFPGGKIEEGESPEEAIVREIQEELNLSIEELHFFKTVNHSYLDFSITMHAFTCITNDISVIELREHLEYKLLEKKELSFLDWAAADIPFVEKLISKIDE